MEILLEKLKKAAKDYSSITTNDRMSFNSPKIYTAFREGQDSAIELIEDGNKALKEDNERLYNALKVLANISLAGVNTTNTDTIIYQRDNTFIRLNDVIAAKEAVALHETIY